MPYPETGDLLVALRDNVATVTLNRPQRRNAVTLAMWNGLAELFDRFAKDDAVRAVILTGAGEHFCAGADISEFATVRNSVASGRQGELRSMRPHPKSFDSGPARPPHARHR